MTELGLAIGQILFQAIFLLTKDFKTILNYSSNLLTVSLLGCLLLLPMLLANQVAVVGEVVAVNYFILVATIMFVEHFRRTELLKLPKTLCFTWVLYRILFAFMLFR